MAVKTKPNNTVTTELTALTARTSITRWALENSQDAIPIGYLSNKYFLYVS